MGKSRFLPLKKFYSIDFGWNVTAFAAAGREQNVEVVLAILPAFKLIEDTVRKRTEALGAPFGIKKRNKELGKTVGSGCGTVDIAALSVVEDPSIHLLFLMFLLLTADSV